MNLQNKASFTFFALADATQALLAGGDCENGPIPPEAYSAPGNDLEYFAGRSLIPLTLRALQGHPKLAGFEWPVLIYYGASLNRALTHRYAGSLLPGRCAEHPAAKSALDEVCDKANRLVWNRLVWPDQATAAQAAAWIKSIALQRAPTWIEAEPATGHGPRLFAYDVKKPIVFPKRMLN